MKRLIALLTAILFAAATPVMAAGVSLSDNELDEIAAGDWVVISEGEEVVSDIYYNTNDIDLEDESQMEIQAVNNVNAVDSAVAAQANIASVTGEPTNNVAVNGSNVANLTNYNPSDSGSESGSITEIESEAKNKWELETESFSLSEYRDSGSTFSLVETDDIDETLDIVEVLAIAAEKECKNCDEEFALAYLYKLDYDYTEDYDLTISGTEWDASGCELNKEEYKWEWESATKTKTKSEEHSSSYRKNLSENNHIDLEDTSQTNMQVVSNLNAVGSAAAAQVNIASNVGVSGTITHSNVATAVNGI